MSQIYKGKYKQLKSIGKGVSGIIYLVQSVIDGKQYCAKHISLAQIQQATAEKELHIIQTLRNPYIVQYVQSFKSQLDFIIIMEYCKEKDLAYHIQLMKSKNKHFNQNLVITWLFQLVLGLQFIHSKKILHRDLKPKNIFIDERLNIKIGDFGVSKILNSTGEHCKSIQGTPYYLAPEICSEEKYTSKVDIWSLGCVIYQICALERPFLPKGGPITLYAEIMHSAVKQIPNIYSSDLRKLVLKMMTRDVSKRPNTTQLLKDPVLVDLMIKNSSSLSLKQQYSKNIQKPKNLTDSFIDKQTKLVHDQLKQFEQQVKLKMQLLKKRQVNNKQVDIQYVQLKNKMQDIQKAISKAFGQLKNKTNGNTKEQKPTIKNNQNSIQKNCSDLSDSSQMTIYESVMIGQNKKSSLNNTMQNKSSSTKKSRLQQIIAQSAQYQSVPVIQTSKQIKSPNKNYHSITSAQSLMIQDSSNFGNSQNLNNFGKKNNKKTQYVNQSQSFDQTLVSNYQKTVKQNPLAKLTIDKLNFLQKTLSQNPDAVLNGSLLNFTLSMSQDQLKRNLNLGMVNPTNTLSMRVRNQKNLEQTISFDLTKRQSQPSQRMQKNFKKKTQNSKLSSSGQNKAQKESKISQGSKQQQYDEYDQDFQQYQQQDEDDLLRQMSSPAMNKRRSQLNTIISFYQQTLQQIGNQSQFQQSLEQTLSNTQRVKNKYPLVMSEIKQQQAQYNPSNQPNSAPNYRNYSDVSKKSI